jgi:hypothetical protein
MTRRAAVGGQGLYCRCGIGEVRDDLELVGGVGLDQMATATERTNLQRPETPYRLLQMTASRRAEGGLIYMR